MIHLKPHQVVARDWLLLHKRTILADVVGLGKTYPAIAAATITQGQTLLVVPAYLQYNWQLAFNDYTPDTNLYSLTGTTDNQQSVLQAFRALSPNKKDHSVLIASYEMFRKHSPILSIKHFNTIIFDEAHKLRGRGGSVKRADGSVKKLSVSQQASAAFQLHSDNTYLLTGTPIVHDVGDLYALLHMIAPKTFTSYWQFVNKWAKITNSPFGQEVGHAKDPEALASYLSSYMLRRTWQQVGISMPEAITTIINVQAPLPFLSRYRKARKEYQAISDTEEPTIEYFSGAGALMAYLYKQVASLPQKISALKQVVAEHDNEQIIIWTWRRDTARLVAEALSLTRKVRVITGDIPPLKRHAILNEHKQSKSDVLIATIASLSTGENIQSTHTTVFYEQSYLPTDNEQAVGRCRRLGQTHQTLVYKIIVSSTVDSIINRIQSDRDLNFQKALMLD